MNLYFTRFLLVVLVLMASPVYADTLVGRVVGVSDGDTVTILDASNTQYKIRLMGIDAPEKNQPFGQKSKQHLADLVFNRSVTVEYSKQDKYGRTVGKITVGEVDANLEQIKAGLAWHYKKYQNEQTADDRIAYAQAENAARTQKLGLWAEPNPVPPWDWRKLHKRGQ